MRDRAVATPPAQGFCGVPAWNADVARITLHPARIVIPSPGNVRRSQTQRRTLPGFVALPTAWIRLGIPGQYGAEPSRADSERTVAGSISRQECPALTSIDARPVNRCSPRPHRSPPVTNFAPPSRCYPHRATPLLMALPTRAGRTLLARSAHATCRLRIRGSGGAGRASGIHTLDPSSGFTDSSPGSDRNGFRSP